MELWPPRFVIELLAIVGWKWGCQPFSCPCSLNVAHCQKEICATCLSKESMPFVKSKPPLRTRSLRSLRAAARSTSSAVWLHHAHPFVAAEEKRQSHAEKQKVWSRSCGLQDMLPTSKIWVTRYWLCSHLWHVTAANQWTIVEIELLAIVGWKWGCQPFSCPCSLNVAHCQKEICATCLSKESMPCVKIQASTPYQKLEVPESDSTPHQLCVMAASCPSIRCSCRKKISHVTTAN